MFSYFILLRLFFFFSIPAAPKSQTPQAASAHFLPSQKQLFQPPWPTLLALRTADAIFFLDTTQSHDAPQDKLFLARVAC